jgi:hypothetical protein
MVSEVGMKHCDQSTITGFVGVQVKIKIAEVDESVLFKLHALITCREV